MRCLSCSNEMQQYCRSSYIDLPVIYCNNCKFYVSGDSINKIKKKISNLYNKDYWDERKSERSINSNYNDVDSEGKKRNWISQYKYCKPFLDEKKKIFEIGVGAGQSAYWFEKEGFDVRGIEPDERNASMINTILKNGHITKSSVEDFETDENFEFIWMSHVLEHILEPTKFLEKIINNLKNDGVFFVEVPNCEFPKMLNDSIEKNPHIYHFSKRSLVNVFKKCGFHVIKSDCFRPATKFEAGLNKLSKKTFPYYPRILTDEFSGRDLRIIVKK